MITVSCGVTAALDGDNPQSLLARADAALYSAKAGGRNCVYRHSGIAVELAVDNEVDMPKIRRQPSLTDVHSTSETVA